MHSLSMSAMDASVVRPNRSLLLLLLFTALLFLGMPDALAHAVAEGDKGFIQESSVTLLLGVLTEISISSYVIDAIIGFSVVYKALDNLGAFQRWFGHQPNTKAATLIFGLLHGFGLATKIQEYDISADGLIANLIAFNVGVEIGQLLALSAILIVMGYLRRTASFWRHAYTANVAMMSAGFLLMGYQLTGLIVSQ
ncbi:MAG: hypothetical protein A3J25_04405 [Pseudomonadales bacterium RIFCSPLOWO2_02_FULL_63_210]|nr:MAG: hypothetical protein A3J25_04405 [Pseudomonadales bacterium RIFCSPLOWO2_02_FULL_63_210]